MKRTLRSFFLFCKQQFYTILIVREGRFLVKLYWKKMQFKYSIYRLWCIVNTLVLCESTWKVCLRELGTSACCFCRKLYPFLNHVVQDVILRSFVLIIPMSQYWLYDDPLWGLVFTHLFTVVSNEALEPFEQVYTNLFDCYRLYCRLFLQAVGTISSTAVSVIMNLTSP